MSVWGGDPKRVESITGCCFSRIGMLGWSGGMELMAVSEAMSVVSSLEERAVDVATDVGRK